MAILPPAFTKKGNVKNIEKAKAAYEKLGWAVTQEFVGSLTNPSYLVITAEEELGHPKRRIVDRVEDFNSEKSAKDARLTELQEQITNIGLIDKTFMGSEIRSLPDILSEDETILGAVGAIINSNKWLILCTQHRVIMLDKGMFHSQQKEIQIKDIDAIETDLGVMNGEIDIKSKASSFKITKALPADVNKFVAAVKEAMADAQSHSNSAKQGSITDSEDIASQITKLAELKAAGVLTEEEFAHAKAKIIG